MSPYTEFHYNYSGYLGDYEGEQQEAIVPLPNPLAMSVAAPKVRSWRWVPLGCRGKANGAILNHWAREDSQGVNTPSTSLDQPLTNVLQYTDTEYSEVIASRCAHWSKANSDHLMELCLQFDSRFLVVYDRFAPVDVGPDVSFSLEDLKEHYYKIQTILHASRAGQDIDTALQTLCYDATHETQRKQQLALLLEKSIEELEDEACLVVESKKIAQRQKKLKDKAGKVVVHHKSASTQPALDPTEPRKQLSKDEKPRKKQKVSSTVDDSRKSIKKKSVASGAFLRRYKYTVGANLSAKQRELLLELYDELKVDLDVMCYTQRIGSALEDLERESCEYLNVRRAVARLESELRGLQARQGGGVKPETGGPAGQPENTSHAIDVESTDGGDGIVDW